MLSIYYGGNSLAWEHSPLQAFTTRLGADLKGHAVGCANKATPAPAPGPVKTMAPTSDPKKKGGIGKVDTTPCDDDTGFAAAAKLAASADVAIVFIGLHPHELYGNNGADSREDEGKDRPYVSTHTRYTVHTQLLYFRYVRPSLLLRVSFSHNVPDTQSFQVSKASWSRKCLRRIPRQSLF